jgi:hypothetical protein
MTIRSHIAQFYRRLPVVRELRLLLEDLRRTRVDCDNMNVRIKNIESILQFDSLERELRNSPRGSDPVRLLCYAHQVLSQNGEDGMIREIFRRIGVKQKTFVEIGVEDGSECNTAFLLTQGWTGWWLDGNEGHQRQFESLRARFRIIPECLRFERSLVGADNIKAIFDRLGIPCEVDLFSLDVDYNTYHLWAALNQFKPRVVVVEYNAALPPDMDWKVAYDPDRVWDGTQNFGASLKAFELLGRQLGYCLVGCDFIGVNAFFVRNDLAGNHFCEPFTAENHYEPPRYGLVHRRAHRRGLLQRQTADDR